MKIKKTMFYSIIVLLLISLTFAACSNGNGDAAKTGAENVKKGEKDGENFSAEGYPIVKEKITLRMVSSKNPMHGEYEDMEIFKKLEEKTNVHVEWDQIPDANYQEKKNLMLNSGKLPDAFFGGLGKSDEMKYGQQGMFIPLEDLVEKYAPNIVQMFDKRPDVKKFATAPDGHIYSVPSLDEKMYENNTDNLFINKLWLDKLGLKPPTTTDEFYEVLKAFKEKDPNGNGKKDEIPFSYRVGTNYQGEYSMFGAFNGLDNPMHLVMEDGKVLFAPIRPGYKEAIKYFNKLYSEGLIDPEVFTQDGKQYFAKGKAEDVILGSFIIYFDENLVGDERAHNDYISLLPLKGPEGYQLWNRYDQTKSGKFIVTSSNEHPEATIRWVNELYDKKASLEFRYGPFGSHLKENSDGSIEFLPPPEGMSSDEFRYQSCPAPVSPGVIYKETYDNMNFPINIERKIERTEKYEPFMVDEIYPQVYYTDSEIEKLSTLTTDVNNYVDQMKAKWITGDAKIDDTWDDYINQLKKMGLDDLIKIYQDAFDRYNSVE